MKVSELIDVLNGMPQDWDVFANDLSFDRKGLMPAVDGAEMRTVRIVNRKDGTHSHLSGPFGSTFEDSPVSQPDSVVGVEISNVVEIF